MHSRKAVLRLPQSYSHTCENLSNLKNEEAEIMLHLILLPIASSIHIKLSSEYIEVS
nr:hypothetical protein [uncultured bacterium]